jgi:hypothetical protein
MSEEGERGETGGQVETEDKNGDDGEENWDVDENGKRTPLAAVSVHTTDCQQFSCASFAEPTTNVSSAEAKAEQERKAKKGAKGSDSGVSKEREDGGDTEILVGDMCRPLLYAVSSRLRVQQRTQIYTVANCCLPLSALGSQPPARV